MSLNETFCLLVIIIPSFAILLCSTVGAADIGTVFKSKGSTQGVIKYSNNALSKDTRDN